MTLKADTFREIIQVVFSNFSELVAKDMANRFIGSLNEKYDKKYKGFLSTSYDTYAVCGRRVLRRGTV